MLENPFLVPSLCKLNHISLCFIFDSLQGKQCFFWSHPRCFGPLDKFQHNIKISIKTARVSRLFVSYDYDVRLLKNLIVAGIPMIINTSLVLGTSHNSLIDFFIFVPFLSLDNFILFILYTCKNQYDKISDWFPCTMILHYIALDAG